MRSKSVTGRLIHLALALSMFLLACRSLAFLLLLVGQIAYLWFAERRLFWLALTTIALAGGSLWLRTKLHVPATTTLTGTIMRVEATRVLVRSGWFVHLVYLDDTASIRPGDVVRVDVRPAAVTTRQMPHAFDYERHLEASDIASVHYGSSPSITGHRLVPGIIPYHVERYLEANFEPQAATYIRLLVLGDTRSLDPRLRLEATRLGIAHLFAISGLHLGLIIGFLDRLLRRLYLSKGAHRALLAGCLVVYNLTTGFKISLIRASLMVIAMFLLDEENPRLSRLDVLSLIYVAMLVYNPAFGSQIGFNLSFGMTFCLMLGKEQLRSRHHALALLKTTVFLNLALLPVLLEAIGGIGVLFPLANLVFITCLRLWLLPLTFLTLFFPFLSGVYLWSIGVFEWAVDLFAGINLFIPVNLSSTWAKGLYCLGFFQPLCFPAKRSIKTGGALLMSLSLLLSLVRLPGLTKVVLFDIGQGDALLIADDASTILIDTGDLDEYDALVNYLRKENIRMLDLVVITHWHRDHCGELADLLACFQVGMIVAPSIPAEYVGMGIHIVQKASVITCGNFAFTVLNAQGAGSENNNSLVLYTRIGGDGWLFLGDAEAEIETELLGMNLDVDIVKVAHHGSKTSSSKDFIAWADPAYALISVGRNAYGLPDPEVVAGWQERATVLITKDDGSILFFYHPFLGGRVVANYRHDRFRLFS